MRSRTVERFSGVRLGSEREREREREREIVEGGKE